MRCNFKYLISIALITAFTAGDFLACTTFCLRNTGEVLFGKNYDWMIGDGVVFVNKRGVSKMASDELNPAKWLSKYGSVTFNQYGWESPSGGMNEAGLVIELMWLDDTQWPQKDERPAIDVLEWIQFNLDTAATANDVIKNSESVRIASSVKLHYLVNDRAGNSATIEFLDGKLVAHSGEKLEVATLTNDTYTRSLNYSKRTVSSATESSLDRFTRAASKTKEFQSKPKTEKESVDYAFGILADVAQKNSTQWSIVYDQKRGKIHFRTRQSPEIKTVDINSFDFACGSPVKTLDMNSKNSGDVSTSFKDYTREANRDLIERAFRGTDFLRGIPAATLDSFATFPEHFPCSAVKFMLPEPKKTKEGVAGFSFLYLVSPIYLVYEQLSAA